MRFRFNSTADCSCSKHWRGKKGHSRENDRHAMQEVTFIKPLCVYLLQVRTQHASYQLFILLGGWKDVCVFLGWLCFRQQTVLAFGTALLLHIFCASIITWSQSSALRPTLSGCGLSCFSRVWLFATLWAVAPPGSSVHGILQEGILKWVAMPSSRGSSQPRDWTQVSSFGGRFFTSWATREALTHSVSIKYSLSFFCLPGLALVAGGHILMNQTGILPLEKLTV